MTDALHRLLRTPQGVLGLALLAVLLLVCLFGGALAPYSPETMDFAGRFAAPGAPHPSTGRPPPPRHIARATAAKWGG